MSHSLYAGSQFTGTAINPARALGPAIVFHCHWNEVWLYIIAGGHLIGLPSHTWLGPAAPAELSVSAICITRSCTACLACAHSSAVAVFACGISQAHKSNWFADVDFTMSQYHTVSIPAAIFCAVYTADSAKGCTNTDGCLQSVLVGQLLV